jgi:hypothetical protein
MKNIAILLSAVLTSFAFLGCTEDKKSSNDAPSSTPATSSEEKSSGLLSSIEKKGESLMSDDPQEENGLSQVSKISDYSETLTNGWNSVKGVDFSDKAALLKKVKSLVSTASKNIGMLKQISPMVTGDTGKALIKQISGLSGQVGSLTSLLDKSSSITSGDWGSYKDQIGSAISSLSGGFSSLSKLAN